MPQVKACLFDMDGLLIDTERIYTETACQLLRNHGKDPTFDLEIKSKMMGRPGPQAAEIFLEWSQIPISPDQYMAEMRALQATRFPESQPLPGALALTTHLHRHGIPIALATSSTTSNYTLKTSKLHHFFDLFQDVRITGDDPRVVGRGKPMPDIFLHALDILNTKFATRIEPSECLVFEDGIPGVKAGLDAGMHVVWVPDAAILALHHNQVDDILEQNGKLLTSLEDLKLEEYGLPPLKC